MSFPTLRLFLLAAAAAVASAPTPASAQTAPGPLFDVTRYGARPNDSRADDRAIQAAVEAAAQRGGGVVWLPRGRYIVARAIEPRSNVWIRGDGAASELRIADGTNWWAISLHYTRTVSNVVFEDFAIDGNKHRQTDGGGIHVGGQGLIARRLAIRNTWAAGIVLGSSTGTRGASILDNTCVNCGNANGWGAFAFIAGDGLTMRGNRATADPGVMAYAFDIEPNPGTTASNIVMENNVARGGRLLVTGREGPNTEVRGVTIRGNDIDAVGAFGSNYDSGGALVVWDADDVVIEDNVFRGPADQSAAMLLDVRSFRAHRNRIVARPDRRPMGGVAVLLVRGGRDGVVTDNDLEGADPAAPSRFGIGTADGPSRVRLDGNRIRHVAQTRVRH